MINIPRLPLPAETAAELEKRQRSVKASSDPAATAKRLWSNLGYIHRQRILRTLRLMASGLERCMYCEDSGGTDIEHFRPKSEYPLYALQWRNYLLACSYCNSNEKRNRFPLLDDKQPALIDPTVIDPTDHLIFSPSTGNYVARNGDLLGEQSIEVFGLNRQVCAQGRKDMWDNLLDIISTYEAKPDRRGGILARISRSPYQGVRAYLAKVWESQTREVLLPPETIETLTRFPELLQGQPPTKLPAS